MFRRDRCLARLTRQWRQSSNTPQPSSSGLHQNTEVFGRDFKFDHRYRPLHPLLSDAEGNMPVQGTRMQFFCSSFGIDLFNFNYRKHSWPLKEEAGCGGSLTRTSADQRGFCKQMRHHFKYKIKGDTAFYISRGQTSCVHHFNVSTRKSGISNLGLKSEAMVVGFDVVDTLLFLLVEYPDKSFEVNVFDLCQDGAPPLATLPLANSDVASVMVISRDPIFFTLADSSHSVLGTFLFSRDSSTISPAQFGLPSKANALVLRDGSLFSLALDYTTLHIARVGEGKHEPCTELDISVTSSPILDFLPTVTSSISESKQPTSLVLFTKQEFSPGVGSYFLHLKLGDSARNHVLSWHPNEGVIMAAGLHTRGQGAAQTKEVLVCISDGDTGLLFEFNLA